jgi:glycosyltransferase involved in cell wall biosynthesis
MRGGVEGCAAPALARTMLSVVIPSYNHGIYLRAALEALLSQTRSADEIIVIDDASTDDSVAVASSFLDRHPNFRFVRNCRNLGCVATLNRGLALAHGSIVYFGAADDLTEPTLFARGVALLEAYPQAALFSARSYVISAAGQDLGVIPTPIPLPAPGFIDRAAAARVLMREDGWFMGNTTLYRRAPLLSLEGFPEDLGSFTDGYVSRVLALGHGACFSPEVLAAWRRLKGGFAWSHTVDRERLVQLTEAARRRMTEPKSAFPAGYAERWQRRYEFGAQRFGLIERRRQAAARGIAAQLAAAVRESALTAWLFLRLRPWDLLPVVRRRLRNLFTARQVSAR